MGLTEMITDLKAHLDHGEQLAASHIPALVEWAARAEADPLVQAAISLAVPEGTKTMLAGLLKSVEAEVQKVEADATAAAEAKAAEAAAAEAAANVPAPEPDPAPA